MAKHLEARSKQTVKKQNDILPKLIKLKKPPRRRFHYERAFSTMEMIPILAAVILFIATCLAPIGHRFKLLAYGITALVAGFSILRHAFERILRLRLPDEDCLILLAALAAFAAREPAAAALIVILGQLARLVSAYAIVRSARSVDFLRDILPETAHVEEEYGVMDIVPEEVVKGDIFIVREGESIPVDGVVIEGQGAVNESVLTGESIPVEKQAGSVLSAATINTSGYLKCEATRVGEDTTLAKIISLVNEASASKAPIAKIADRVSGIFVPAVISIAAVTFVIWMLLGHTVGFSLARAISVLVISCPCALGLATPVAITVGSGVAAKNGILFKNAVSLEETGKAGTGSLQ